MQVQDKDIERLSARELEVLALFVQGYTVKEIAKRLFIEKVTVQSHKHSIYCKLNLRPDIKVIAWYWQYGKDKIMQLVTTRYAKS